MNKNTVKKFRVLSDIAEIHAMKNEFALNNEEKMPHSRLAHLLGRVMVRFN